MFQMVHVSCKRIDNYKDFFNAQLCLPGLEPDCQIRWAGLDQQSLSLERAGWARRFYAFFLFFVDFYTYYK